MTEVYLSDEDSLLEALEDISVGGGPRDGTTEEEEEEGHEGGG